MHGRLFGICWTVFCVRKCLVLNFFLSIWSLTKKVHRSKTIVESNPPIASIRAVLRLYRHPRGPCKVARAGRPAVRRTWFLLPVSSFQVYTKARLVGRCFNRCRLCCSRLRTDTRRRLFYPSTSWKRHRTSYSEEILVCQ